MAGNEGAAPTLDLRTRDRRGRTEEGEEEEDKAELHCGRGFGEFSMAMMAGSAPDGDNARMISASLKRYAWLSIGAALATIALKGVAWRLTGSVGLLSDALESLVNLAGAVMALAMLTLAAQPEDENHAYGHGKAEYFSSGFEGLLILLAAIAISVTAIERLLHPQPVEQLGIGLTVSLVASIINFVTARILLTAGRKNRSITLEADAHHLMTDVWTSAGVIFGVGAVGLTGWLWLDPVLALLVAGNIIWTGWRLLQRSADGLMDVALPPEQQGAVVAALDNYRRQGIDYHALRTRQAGANSFVDVHVLVPGAWTVQRGHDLLEKLESDIRVALPHATVLTHLEPLEDPASQDDIRLTR
ncbi:MAG: cation diffusion facilitator family transporter [Burkholderiales bacterium]